MPPTSVPQVPFAAATVAAGSGSVAGSAWLAIGYGVSIHGKATNGATGPGTGVQFVVEVAEDSSGTNPQEADRGSQADLAANAVNRWRCDLGVAGNGGDYPYYRVSFARPTGQDVACVARAMSTTALS